MALNWDKYYIEVQDDDAIKCNQIFYDFVQRMLNHMDGLFMVEHFILIYAIKKDKLRKQSAAKFEIPNREKKDRKRKKETTSKPSTKKGFFVNKTTRISLATSNTSNLNINADIPQWSLTCNSEEEDTGMSKGKIKIMLII